MAITHDGYSMDGVDPDPILPPEPDLELLNQRIYAVRAWRIDARNMLLRGAVEDRKPGTLWPGNPDEDLVVHHMVVDLTISYPDLEITEAEVKMEVHPHGGCPRIEDNYHNLVGLSIARGFTHHVRERFGGPKGCAHTTALLQAMAPVAVQTTHSMRLANERDNPGSEPQIAARPAFLRNTCHLWAEDGEMWSTFSEGTYEPVLIPMRKRLERAGLDPDTALFAQPE